MLTMGLIENLARLNRLRQPEPIVYAKGTGAKGVFIPYMTMKEYTKACFLQDAELETPAFVRFSRMMGRAGSSDTARDVRGFFVKFYTREGNYDMTGTNLPVSFIRDPEKYPALLESLSPCKRTNIRDPEHFWRFVSDNPETMHMVTWLYSDRGTIKSYRTMEGHSVHTYLWENNQGDRYWVRYHWRPLEGVEEISRQEAEFLAGYDPDAAARDLLGTFDEGRTVSYELNVQLISAKQCIESESALLDPTVMWAESSVPWMKVGKLILKSGVDNYREEVENCCFSPGHLIPGIHLSPEPLLLAETFLSMDEERGRWGVAQQGMTLPYPEQKVVIGDWEMSLREKNLFPSGQLAWRFHSMNEREKNTLVENMGEEMLFLEEDIQQTIVGYLKEANKAMGASLEKWLGL